MCCIFQFLRLGALRGDAGRARQRGSGLCSALSRAAHTPGMLLQFSYSLSLSMFYHGYSAWQLRLVPRLRCRAESTQPPKFASQMQTAQQFPSAVVGFLGHAWDLSATLQPYVQALSLLVPPSLPHLHAETLVGEQRPLPQVRTEKSPPAQSGTLLSFSLAWESWSTEGIFSPQPDLQTLSKVNSFALWSLPELQKVKTRAACVTDFSSVLQPYPKASLCLLILPFASEPYMLLLFFLCFWTSQTQWIKTLSCFSNTHRAHTEHWDTSMRNSPPFKQTAPETK